MRPARRRFDLRIYLLVALAALAALAAYAHGWGDVVPQTAIAVAAAGGLDVALRASLTGERTFPSGGLISGLIVALLLPQGQPWYVPLAAAALAVGSKHLVRRHGRNIFNPAALGATAAVFLFPGALEYGHSGFLEAGPRLYYAQSQLRMEDWSFLLVGGHGWTGSTSAVAVVVLGAVVVYRMRRFGLVASYLATYGALLAGFALVTGQDLVVRMVVEIFATGMPFFVLFMLTDPATSPRTPRGRTVFGAGTAVLSFVLRFIVSPVLFLLLALLAANAALGLRRVPLRPQLEVAPATRPPAA